MKHVVSPELDDRLAHSWPGRLVLVGVASWLLIEAGARWARVPQLVTEHEKRCPECQAKRAAARPPDNDLVINTDALREDWKPAEGLEVVDDAAGDDERPSGD